MKAWQCSRAVSSLSAIHIRDLPWSELSRLLQFCSNSKCLYQAKQVHQQICVFGMNRDPFLTTRLVQVYTECNDVRTARMLLGQLPKPNIFAWTALMAYYSRNAMFEECFIAFREMKARAISPDKYVFPKVLRACAHSSCLKLGLQVHKDVVVYGVEFNVVVCNSLIDMYSKCSDVFSARQLFDATLERDLLSWNIMISGYVSNEYHSMAIELFSFMEMDEFEPDIITWNTILDAYCRMEQCNDAWKTFNRIKEPNIISWTTLMRGHLRMAKHEETLGIFRYMMSCGNVLPDLDCLGSVLVSCRQLRVLKRGREIHVFGIKFEAPHNFYKTAGPALLIMYARCGRIRDSRNVFNLMDKYDVVTWNAMIYGFSDLDMGYSALECFKMMRNSGVKYNQTTVATVLPICDLKTGQQLHAHVEKGGFSAAVAVCNALIHMYSKGGCVLSALSLFSGMENRDDVSWNTMIGCFGIHGSGEAALHLLQEMSNSGFCPSPSTFTSVLSACSHSGLAKEGLKLFDRMTKEFGFIPSIEHYACVVDLLTRAGQLEDAVTFIKRMPLEPDKRIWGAVLAASLDHQNTNFVTLASENLIHLEPENAGHYVTLSNVYAREGRWDEAVRVREVMESRKMVKPFGFSRIES